MSKRKQIIAAIVSIVASISMLLVGLGPIASQAASHREAPLISMDPTADITDFFMFRSYEPGHEGNIVLIMDVIPGEEPSSGPNYWNFDPRVLYTFSIDNNMDGKAEDIRFEFRFKTEYREVIPAAGLFLSYVALPPITALDGPGSEGLGLRQKYSVTMVKGGKRKVIGEGLIAVPSNVGPRTMPNYEALAAQGIYSLENGIRVFAGQRQDPFYIDLGGIFDTLNLRRTPLPLLTPQEDANDTANAFGVDMLSGFNVHTIALEVPANLLTRDGRGADETEQPRLGAFARTSRPRVQVLSGKRNGGASSPQQYVQVQRLANPLINEAIIGTVDKDEWNAKFPQNEGEFLDYYLNPRLALALELVYGVPAAQTGRQDLVDLLLKYQPGDTKYSELLRLDISVPPTPFGSQKRLGPLAHDAAGNPTPDPAAWPNGRRPVDDVTDIAVRVIGGANYVNALAGDGINVDDAPLTGIFPFLATPFDGLNRIHGNP